MAQQIINVGSAPNDDSGDRLRPAGIKINNNFTELFTRVQDAEEDILNHTHNVNTITNLSSAGIAFRDGLEALVGNDRLDASAIKNLPPDDGTGHTHDISVITGVTTAGASFKTALEALSGDNRLDASAIKNLAGPDLSLADLDDINTVEGGALLRDTLSLLTGGNRLDASAIKNLPVGGGGGAIESVNGQTGIVVLDSTDVGAAAASHTHTISAITDASSSGATYKTALEALTGGSRLSATAIKDLPVAGVSSVNALTGAVVLTAADVGAAAISHTQAISTITGLQLVLDDIDAEIGDVEAALNLITADLVIEDGISSSGYVYLRGKVF